MELQSISQVSRQFSVSTRTLRYYEQIGLITSARQEDSAYRAYDEEAVTRLRQIIVLRKLRIPLKQIAQVLQRADARFAIETFQRNLAEIEDEITALSTIRRLMQSFVEHLNLRGAAFALPDDEGLLEVVDSLTVSKTHFGEDKPMGDLNRANEQLDKLMDRDIRILYLPPAAAAVAYAEGEGCEGRAGDLITRFASDSGLLRIKPDARSFGFDCSKETLTAGEPSRAYGMWVSVPAGLPVPEPLVKQTFGGGLYAAHVLRSWDFSDWRRLKNWVKGNEKYESDWTSRWGFPESAEGRCFEETLNFYHFVKNGGQMKDLQIDLLFPIRERENSSSRRILSGSTENT